MTTDHHHHFFLVSNGRLMDLVRWELLNQIEAGGGTLSSFVPIRNDTSSNPVFVLVCIEGIHDVSILKYLLGNCALLRWVYQAPHVHCGYGMEQMLFQHGDEVTEGRIIGRRKRQTFRHDNNSYPPLHILADYRGLSTSQEAQAMCYVCRYFCDGGDQFCRTMGREAHISNHQPSVHTSLSAHATTRMDFTRSYLTVTSARIQKGMVVLDPFVGSGAILQVARQMGASIVLGNDLIPNNCRLCYRQSKEILSVVASIHHSPWTDNVIDCIVTDPPYGIRTQSLSTSMKNAPTSVLLDLLHCADRVLVEGGRLVFWWPGVDGNTVLRSMEELLRTCALDCQLRIVAVAGDELGLGKSMVNDDMGASVEEEEVEDNNDDDDEQQEMGTSCDIDDDDSMNACPESMLQQQEEEEDETRKTRSHQGRKTLLQCRWQRCLVVMQKDNNHSNSNDTKTRSISPTHLLPAIFSSTSSPSSFRIGTSDGVSEVIEIPTVLSGGDHIPSTRTMTEQQRTWNVTILDQLFTAARRGDTATLDRIATDPHGIFGSSLARCSVDTTPLNHHASSPCPLAIPCAFPNDTEESIWDVADAHDCRLLMYVIILFLFLKGTIVSNHVFFLVLFLSQMCRRVWKMQCDTLVTPTRGECEHCRMW